MNARERIECAFPAYFVFCLWQSLAKQDKDNAYVVDIARATFDIHRTIINTGIKKETDNLLRRLVRLYDDVINKHYANSSMVKMTLLFYQFMEWLQENHLEIGDGKLRHYSDLLFKEVDTLDKDFSVVSKSAEKQCGKLIKYLQDHGYYK